MNTEENKTVLVPDWDKPLNRQDIFNVAWNWAKNHGPCMINQGTPFEKCAYRSKEGDNACLMGACIPDSLYKKKFESEATEQVFRQVKTIFCNDVTIDFLMELQQRHDNIALRLVIDITIQEELQKFALKYNLNIPNDN